MCSEVSFIAFRRKAKRHMRSMCCFPQELAGNPGRRPGLPASMYIYIYIYIYRSQNVCVFVCLCVTYRKAQFWKDWSEIWHICRSQIKEGREWKIYIFGGLVFDMRAKTWENKLHYRVSAAAPRQLINGQLWWRQILIHLYAIGQKVISTSPEGYSYKWATHRAAHIGEQPKGLLKFFSRQKAAWC